MDAAKIRVHSKRGRFPCRQAVLSTVSLGTFEDEGASIYGVRVSALQEAITEPQGYSVRATTVQAYVLYGLAWLLQLAAELNEWDDPDARQWSATLRPLAQAATARITSWLPTLEHPIRTGEHNNTAFALGLMLDFARACGSTEFGKLLESRARDYYLKDQNCPLSYEPSGEDFLSPCLAEADAVRRILPEAEFARCFTAFLPQIDLEPTLVIDITDGKPYHLAGLNLSRAWMLEGIVSKLPAVNARRKPLTALARRLRQAGLDSIRNEHYEGGHWLGSFAVYLVSGRGRM